MDAAVALQRKKTIKFLCIVDFPLSKQGIFFITLTHVKSYIQFYFGCSFYFLLCTVLRLLHKEKIQVQQPLYG